MKLHPVEGHDEIRASLAAARRAGSLPAALLIHGAPGVGKQRLALWIGQLLLCEAPQESGPCQTCKPCYLASKIEHPDLHWHRPLARPKGASTPEKLADKLEEARHAELAELRDESIRMTWTSESRAHYLAAARTIRSRAHRRPSMGDTQIFVIADAETLVPQESSPEAANSLLKLLEEPPEGTRLILTSSEPGRLLQTIRSRCMPLHLPALPVDRVERFLVDVEEADPTEAALAARLSHGSIGRALGFLPDDDGPGPLDRIRSQALDVVRAALDPGPGAGFRLALSFGPAGARGMLDLFDFVSEWLRDLAAASAGAPAEVVNSDHEEEIVRLARGVDADAAAGSLASVERAREQARGNVNPQLIVSGLVSDLRRVLGASGAAA